MGIVVAGVLGLAALGELVSAPEESAQVVAAGASSAEAAGGLAGGDIEPRLVPTPAAGMALPAGDDAVVERVIDGDTLVLTDGTRIRLIGVDAPESSPSDCFARQATAALEDMAGAGTAVRLAYDVERLDRYGRTLAYVHRSSDGLFVNVALAREGYASQLTVPPNVAFEALIGEAVEEARDERHGLWAACVTTSTAVTTLVPSTTATSAPPPDTTPPVIPTPGAVAPPATSPPSTAPPLPPPAAGGCHPSYAGACVPIDTDVDCSRSANGPSYVDARNIRVVGPDEYGLDADNDGIACEG